MRIFATSRASPAATPEQLMADMDAEVAKGRELYADGLIVQAYMDPDYTRTFMVLEAPSVAAAAARLAEYPQVRAGLISFDLTPLIGMPAVAQAHEATGEPLPSWWPIAAAGA